MQQSLFTQPVPKTSEEFSFEMLYDVQQKLLQQKLPSEAEPTIGEGVKLVNTADVQFRRSEECNMQ